LVSKGPYIVFSVIFDPILREILASPLVPSTTSASSKRHSILLVSPPPTPSVAFDLWSLRLRGFAYSQHLPPPSLSTPSLGILVDISSTQAISSSNDKSLLWSSLFPWSTDRGATMLGIPPQSPIRVGCSVLRQLSQQGRLVKIVVMQLAKHPATPPATTSSTTPISGRDIERRTANRS
jgi:hypothetical protein